jgi:hypothetical protein
MENPIALEDPTSGSPSSFDVPLLLVRTEDIEGTWVETAAAGADATIVGAGLHSHVDQKMEGRNDTDVAAAAAAVEPILLLLLHTEKA